MKGLIAAGGNATRLEELTRVTNKHLLPVGHWPMVYYPLQLLQRAGVREVLIVTGSRKRCHGFRRVEGPTQQPAVPRPALGLLSS